MIKKGREVLGRASLETVLSLVGVKTRNKDFKHPVRCGDKTYMVKFGSQRLRLFKNSCKCAHCNRVGTHFLLERDYNHTAAHFNLYSDDGVLFTKDHIIPKSKGGSMEMSNLQTMCSRCNSAKGDKLEL